jgi:hypothetical protein
LPITAYWSLLSLWRQAQAWMAYAPSNLMVGSYLWLLIWWCLAPTCLAYQSCESCFPKQCFSTLWCFRPFVRCLRVHLSVRLITLFFSCLETQMMVRWNRCKLFSFQRLWAMVSFWVSFTHHRHHRFPTILNASWWLSFSYAWVAVEPYGLH